MARWPGLVLEQLRNVFARETLPVAPEVRRRRRRGMAALLFAVEPLPLEPELRRPRRGLVRSLLAPEPLALEPEPPPRRHTPWLRWLFALERLDHGTNRSEVH